MSLSGNVAVVTGASRGIGKGVAIELAAAGATVYATGRTIAADDFPAARVIPLTCDHTDDQAVAAACKRIVDEHGRVDVLVNNVWGGYERMMEDGQFTWPLPFWKQPLWRWDAMFQAGVRAHYVASTHAARAMVAQGRGLIVNISFWAAHKHIGNVAYGAAKAATDKLTVDMAHELQKHNVAVVSLYPGLVRTELVMEAADFLDLSNSESPQFLGRAVAALAADEQVLQKTGKVLVAATVVQEYGFADIDGKQPRPLTIGEV